MFSKCSHQVMWHKRNLFFAIRIVFTSLLMKYTSKRISPLSNILKTVKVKTKKFKYLNQRLFSGIVRGYWIDIIFQPYEFSHKLLDFAVKKSVFSSIFLGTTFSGSRSRVVLGNVDKKTIALQESQTTY